MKKTVRLVGVILVIAMVISFAPVTAFAAESDGMPTVVDVSEITENIYIIEENNYDPDGFVFTGNNPSILLYDNYGTDITFKDLTISGYHLNFTGSVTVTLSGDNVFVSDKYCSVSNLAADVIINAEENASLTATTNGYFISDYGHGGSLTVNGGDINITATEESEGYSLICANYTQNGGNVTIVAKNNSALCYGVVLNGGTLTASSDIQKVISNNNGLTIAPGAQFNATSPEGMLYYFGSFLIAEGSPENSFLFAKTSADGEFVPVNDASVLKEEKYLELKVDTHIHSFDNAEECICGALKADYSGYDTAIDRYNNIFNEYSDSLTDDAKDYIRTEIKKISEEYFGGTGIKKNYTTQEQYILDGVEDGLNNICDTVEKGVADGTFIKPDYTAIEARIAEFEKVHPGEEYKAFIDGLKADLETLKATNPETHADATDDIAAIEAEIVKAENCGHACHKDGFLGFLWKIANFFSKLFKLNPVCECGAAHY